MKAYEGKSCDSALPINLATQDSSERNRVDVFITYAADGTPQIPADQMQLSLNSDNEVLWASTQPFSIWFSDRTVKAPEHVSSKPHGYGHALKLHARDFPHTNLPYEYTIDANGGRLDPSVIIKPH